MDIYIYIYIYIRNTLRRTVGMAMKSLLIEFYNM